MAALAALLAPAPAPARIKTPKGVKVERVARGIPNPSNVAIDPKGGIWVTSAGNLAAPSDGVWYVRRPRATPRHVVDGLFSALGLTWHRGRLYVSHIVPYATFAPDHTGRVAAFWGFDGRRFAHEHTVADGIPAGRHRPDSIVPGPDGRLYLGVGSAADDRRGPPPSAGIVSFRPGSGRLRVEAKGLRNPYGLAFVPGTDRLLISEHGRDDEGLDAPREEVDALHTKGPPRDFGFPRCPHRCKRPLATLAPHSAPGALATTTAFGRWGASAFLPRFGSSFAARPTGGDVVRIDLRTNKVHRFAANLGLQQPLGAAMGPDGALYVTRWKSGEVLRFSARSAPRGLAGLLLGLLAERDLDVLVRAGNALLDLSRALQLGVHLGAE